VPQELAIWNLKARMKSKTGEGRISRSPWKNKSSDTDAGVKTLMLGSIKILGYGLIVSFHPAMFRSTTPRCRPVESGVNAGAFLNPVALWVSLFSSDLDEPHLGNWAYNLRVP
jgi:hypothetical protein